MFHLSKVFFEMLICTTYLKKASMREYYFKGDASALRYIYIQVFKYQYATRLLPQFDCTLLGIAEPCESSGFYFRAAAVKHTALFFSDG